MTCGKNKNMNLCQVGTLCESQEFIPKVATIMFIIFGDFLMVEEQIFPSPQVKRNMIISNKLLLMSCLTSCGTNLGKLK